MKIAIGTVFVTLLSLTACERRQDPILKALDGWTFVGGAKYDQRTGCDHGTAALPFPKSGTLIVGNCYVFHRARSAAGQVAFEAFLARIKAIPKEEVMITNDPWETMVTGYVGGPSYRIEILQQRDRTSGFIFFTETSSAMEFNQQLMKDWFPDEVTIVYES